MAGTRKKKPGKALEELVSSIERALGHSQNVSVEHPAYLPDRITGEPREHDVLITVAGSHHKLTIAIECRDRTRRLPVNAVEEFWTKCQDTGVSQGILVSRSGFTKAAIQKASHRGIRCLRLSQATSFNWLLGSGITCQRRKILHTHWRFLLKENVEPRPEAFSVLTSEGLPLDPDVLVKAAYVEFQKLPEAEFHPGVGEKKIAFKSPGLVLRDKATNATYPVAVGVATVRYEIVEEFVPFDLITYVDSSSGDLITDAAVANVDFGRMTGKLMIVYKESEGGNVLFAPDRTEPV